MANDTYVTAVEAVDRQLKNGVFPTGVPVEQALRRRVRREIQSRQRKEARRRRKVTVLPLEAVASRLSTVDELADREKALDGAQLLGRIRHMLKPCRNREFKETPAFVRMLGIAYTADSAGDSAMLIALSRLLAADSGVHWSTLKIRKHAKVHCESAGLRLLSREPVLLRNLQRANPRIMSDDEAAKFLFSRTSSGGRRQARTLAAPENWNCTRGQARQAVRELERKAGRLLSGGYRDAGREAC